MAERVCIAQIGAAHGIRGEVRLKAFTQDPMAVARYGALEAEDGSRAFEIVSVRPARDMLVARLKGIGDRDAAERLKNLRLYVPRSRLPEPEPGEFYHADLVGLPVTTAAGAAYGTVVAVHNFGAGDLIEIKPVDQRETVMLPFTEAAFPVVDIAARRLVIAPPEGS
jgi:16S rRNA processing protein RimM